MMGFAAVRTGNVGLSTETPRDQASHSLLHGQILANIALREGEKRMCRR